MQATGQEEQQDSRGHLRRKDSLLTRQLSAAQQELASKEAQLASATSILSQVLAVAKQLASKEAQLEVTASTLGEVRRMELTTLGVFAYGLWWWL